MIKNYIFSLAFCFCASFSINSFSQSVDDISFMTENYPPFNFVENNKLQGVSVDLMVEILKALKSTQTRNSIDLVPWARGYMNVLSKKNACLFTMTRTKERENKFKWVGPITSTVFSLIAKVDRHITINSLEEIKPFHVGVIKNDWGERFLVNSGVDVNKLDSLAGTNVILRSLQKLDLKRIDLFAYSLNAVRWELKKNKVSQLDYESVYTLQKSDVYYAFNKDTSDELVQKFQLALDTLKKHGGHQKILNQYY